MGAKAKVAPSGFEPELQESKSRVLPLHHGAVGSLRDRSGYSASSQSASQRFQVTRPSGNQIASSRSAASGLSLPWTRLAEREMPKSPRMVPGAALRPSVAPTRLRTTAIDS